MDMIKSMTGYGGCKKSSEDHEYSVDIKTVNHRFLEINLKMPKEFIKFEFDIKNLVSKYINRGKVDIFISFKSFCAEDYKITPNLGIMKQYLEAINIVRQHFSEVQDDFSLSTFIKLPDALIIENYVTDNEKLKEELISCVELALFNLDKMRTIEGNLLKEDILNRIDRIKEIINGIQTSSSNLVDLYRERLNKRLKSFNLESIDENRLMLEITIFADKSDITEEIVRIKSHIEQFINTLQSGGVVGKKLDFILQEMNREANTIGSKSISFEISKYVVDLKDELEKIREQVQNIE